MTRDYFYSTLNLNLYLKLYFAIRKGIFILQMLFIFNPINTSFTFLFYKKTFKQYEYSFFVF